MTLSVRPPSELASRLLRSRRNSTLKIALTDSRVILTWRSAVSEPPPPGPACGPAQAWFNGPHDLPIPLLVLRRTPLRASVQVSPSQQQHVTSADSGHDGRAVSQSVSSFLDCLLLIPFSCSCLPDPKPPIPFLNRQIRQISWGTAYSTYNTNSCLEGQESWKFSHLMTV